MEDLRYPIGRYEPASAYSLSRTRDQVNEIKEMPLKLENEVEGLTDNQLDTSYRPEGWTVRRLIHHVADSHMNSYIRMKWALTEDKPTIKSYNQQAWAELPDSDAPSSISLNLLKSLHERWFYLLESLDEDDLMTEYRHPETGTQTLWRHIELYAWHGRHHLAHITSIIERKNWK